MPLELIYTSAEKGLRSGSQGYCTVACTDGLTPNMVQLLEQLSAYRHLITPTSPDNPVVHSHLIHQMNGINYHLLSRIADPGLDYTRRSNIIAHHLIFTEQETKLYPCGPAVILDCDNLFEKQWNRPPKKIAVRNPLDVPDKTEPHICNAWGEATGDSGWGGYIASLAVKKTPICIAFRRGQKTLTFIKESLDLLDEPEMRWKISFCSWFTKYPPQIQCQWKCVLEHSTEEGIVRGATKMDALQTKFINLNDPGSMPIMLDDYTQRYITYARKGKEAQNENLTIANDSFDTLKPKIQTEYDPIFLTDNPPSVELPELLDGITLDNSSSQIYDIKKEKMDSIDITPLQKGNGNTPVTSLPVPQNSNNEQKSCRRNTKKSKKISSTVVFWLVFGIALILLCLAFLLLYFRSFGNQKKESPPVKQKNSKTTSNNTKQEPIVMKTDKQEPTTQSATSQPATSQSATSQSATSQPATSQPVTSQPVTSQPVKTEDSSIRKEVLQEAQKLLAPLKTLTFELDEIKNRVTAGPQSDGYSNLDISSQMGELESFLEKNQYKLSLLFEPIFKSKKADKDVRFICTPEKENKMSWVFSFPIGDRSELITLRLKEHDPLIFNNKSAPYRNQLLLFSYLTWRITDKNNRTVIETTFPFLKPNKRLPEELTNSRNQKKVSSGKKTNEEAPPRESFLSFLNDIEEQGLYLYSDQEGEQWGLVVEYKAEVDNLNLKKLTNNFKNHNHSLFPGPIPGKILLRSNKGRDFVVSIISDDSQL